MTYYIVAEHYVGPNREQHLDEDHFEIRTEPTRYIMTGTLCIEGWAGTHCDWASYGHGAYESLEDAVEKLDELLPDGYREVDAFEPWEDDIEMRVKPGRYEPASIEAIAASIEYYWDMGKLTRPSSLKQIIDTAAEIEVDLNLEGATTTHVHLEQLISDFLVERDAIFAA